MEIKIGGLVFTLLLVLSTVVYAMAVSVEVESTVDGTSSFFEFDNFSVVSVRFDWENIGSIDCNARLRIDIIDNLSKIHTSWSEKYALAPGEGKLFKVYYLPDKSGNYTAEVKLYYCNEIIDLTSFNFSFSRPEFKDLNISIETISTENKVDFILESGTNLNELKIVSKDFPKGWIFNSVNVEGLKEDEKKTVTLNYEPAVWMPRNVTFAIISGDMYKEVEVKLEKEKEPTFLLIKVLVLLLIISFISNIYFLRRNRKNKEL